MLLLLALSVAGVIAGITTVFYTISELVSSLHVAGGGDILLLASGRYSFNGTIAIQADGVTVAAEVSGGVVIANSFINVKVKGDVTTLEDFTVIAKLREAEEG